MSLIFALVAVVCCIASAVLLYLASPQQQLRATGPWPSRHCWLPGTLLSLLSLLAMWQVLAPLETVFAWSILLMLVWSVMPFLGAWRAHARAPIGGREPRR